MTFVTYSKKNLSNAINIEKTSIIIEKNTNMTTVSFLIKKLTYFCYRKAI